MKHCKDCKFYERGFLSLFSVNKRCKNSEVVEAVVEAFPILNENDVIAEIERGKYGICGPDARYWEKK